MRLSSVFFVLLFSSASFAAQAQAGPSHPIYVRPPASRACPIGFSAKRESGLQAYSTDSAEAPLSLGIDVDFKNSTSRVIVKADILVHGAKTAGHEGLILTGPASFSRDSTESIQVVGTPSTPLLHRLILTKSMTAVGWLELTRLEYADGRIWQANDESRCTAVPTLYFPI